MKSHPPLPPIDDAPDGLLDSGHLWLLEYVEGGLLRFQLTESGLVRFGSREGVFDDPEALPSEFQHAVRHVRERLDREALRSAVDDVSGVVFFGVATYRQSIDYDWERLPSFLGCDVWSADAGEFRPPDAAAAIFERLGLDPVNALEREVRARDFDPDAYTIPRSAWYDGPAAGVVVRNKTGRRAKLDNPAVGGGASGGVEPIEGTPASVAAAYATPARFERLASRLGTAGRPVTVEALSGLVLEDVEREAHDRLHHDEASLDREALRGEVATLARSFLEDRPADAW